MKTVKEWLAEQLKKETETVETETETESVETETETVETERTDESALVRELKGVKEQLSKSLELNNRMVHMLEPSNGNDLDINKAFNSFDRYSKKGEK